MNTVPRFDPLAFGETALKLRSFRHEVLSSNLVNAGTPNYKARDIDFPSVLEARLKGQMDPTSLGLDLTHQAHIAVHQAAMQDPKIMQLVGQNPQAQAILAAAMAHVNEHIAFEYRRQMEQQMGIVLPLLS